MLNWEDGLNALVAEGIEAIVFRTVGDQPSLWESILPEEVRRLARGVGAGGCAVGRSEVLHTVYAVLRPADRSALDADGDLSAVDVLEVSLSAGLREPVPGGLGLDHLADVLPDPAGGVGAASDDVDEADHTLRAGGGGRAQRGLLAKAAEAKLLRTNRVRADTTVVPANVAYPTDSGLLAKAVRRIAATGKRIQAAGGAVRTRVRDRSRAAGKRAHAVAAKLRSRAALGRDEATAAVLKSTGELAGLAADRGARRRAAAGQRQAGGAPGRTPKPPHCALAVSATRRLAGGGAGWCARSTICRSCWPRPARSPRRPANGFPDSTPEGATRRVSLHDGDARPIAKGRLGRPVEFGYKAQVTDNDDGVVLDHTVDMGNPPDAPAAGAGGRAGHQAHRAYARSVTADRGYGEKRVEDALHDLGVRTVVIPRKGKPSQARRAAEHRPAFRRTIKWRTGCEGRISTLKRGYGWDRTRIDNTEGARIWAGHGILTHNLVKISALAA